MARLLRLAAPAELLPALEETVLALGGASWTGVEEPGRFEATLPDEAAETLPQALSQLFEAFGLPLPDYAFEPLPERDWVAESQRALPPQIAGRFFVHGSHVTEPPPPGLVPLLIEAAVAFGTGRHESTKGCLLALSALAAAGRQATRALDLGCGSGVLALAAAKLWRCRVLAADNDPQAVAVAAENAEINREAALVSAVLSEGYAAAEIAAAAPFDLIVANILAGPLIEMAPDLARHLAPRGHAILSGLLIREAPSVAAAHAARGLTSVASWDLGDWRTLLLQRR